jgi:membrane carboxypeptidase/penicillin-binding protein
MELLWRELERVLPQDVIDGAGLKVYTTLDGTMQRAAVAAVDEQLAAVEARAGYPHEKKADTGYVDPQSRGGTPYLQASALAVDNHNGGIRVLVGGRDYASSKFNRAYFAERQVGSAVKPFVYAAAFAAGMHPDTPVSDDRLRAGELPKAFGAYNPSNSDDTYRGMLRAKDGLILSRNTMSVRIGAVAGIERVRENILASGIGTDVPKSVDFPRFVQRDLACPDHGLRCAGQRRGRAHAAFARPGGGPARSRPLPLQRIRAAHPAFRCSPHHGGHLARGHDARHRSGGGGVRLSRGGRRGENRHDQ